MPARLADDELASLNDWDQTAAEYPGDLCVQDAFEQWARRAPKRIALRWGDERISYGELNERAEKLAEELRRRDIGRGALVAILVDRSPRMVVAVLAVLKTGAAYLPLDPLYPRQRVEGILEASGAALLLTEEKHVDRCRSGATPVLVVDRAEDNEPKSEGKSLAARRASAGRPYPWLTPAGPRDLAYVIYTSGSTGAPKGVEIEHGSVVNLLHAMANRVGIDAESVLLAVTTISFDIAALELFLPLTVGGAVALAPAHVAADGQRLLALLQQSEATVLQATPATWRLLLAAGWEGSPNLTALCGGEALPADLAGQLVMRVAALWNLYGPTETTIWSTAQRLDRAGEPVFIGTPLA